MITVTLTPGQASLTVQALEWALNPDYPASDPANRRIQRIIDKIRATQA